MSTTKNTQESPPIRDRSAAKQAIRDHIEREAHAAGYSSHAELEEAEYQAWQQRAGLSLKSRRRDCDTVNA